MFFGLGHNLFLRGIVYDAPAGGVAVVLANDGLHIGGDLVDVHDRVGEAADALEQRLRVVWPGDAADAIADGEAALGAQVGAPFRHAVTADRDSHCAVRALRPGARRGAGGNVGRI